MPSYKVGNEYKDICFPITQECRKQLHEAVIGAYEQAISQGQDTVAKASWDAVAGRTADGDGRNVTGLELREHRADRTGTVRQTMRKKLEEKDMRNMMKKAAQNVKAVAVRAGMLMKDARVRTMWIRRSKS